MCAIFALIYVVAAMVMGAMYVWVPSLLPVVYTFNEAIWSTIIDLVAWILPEPERTAFTTFTVGINALVSGAEWSLEHYAWAMKGVEGGIQWALGPEWTPKLLGEETQNMGLFLLHGLGVFGTIGLASIVTHLVRWPIKIRAWRRRKRLQAQVEPLF